MISVTEAKKIIEENSFAAEPVQLPLDQAAGHILAEDIFSGIDIPSFPQSSMDGYAFSYREWKKEKRLRVSGEIAAGNSRPGKILAGEAVRIFTGAAVPQGADTVLMQEKSKLENGELIIEDEMIQSGDNVRLQGSEIKNGSMALSKYTLLTPASVGYLAGMGFSQLPVFPNPLITIIVTGNELQCPGKPLQYGQVYEANSYSLAAAIKQLGIGEPKKFFCDDNQQNLMARLAEALNQNDVIIITGGVSVGDYDFTTKAAIQCGVETLFHKIKQKPGKPIFFGKKDSKLVFGLPGNPASVLTCFYLYVIPAIGKYTGNKGLIKTTSAVSGSMIRKPAGISWFLKGYYENGIAKSLDAQESYRLSSFARANCLIKLEENQVSCSPGDPIEIYLLPQ